MAKKVKMMLSLVLVCSLNAVLIQCVVNDSYQIELSPVEIALEKYAISYGIDPSMMIAIRHRESMDGRDLWSNSYSVLSRQEWVWKLPIKQLYARYGKRIWYCCGDYQVAFLTAYDDGYRGSPMTLGTNIMTNTKYACKVFGRYLKRYPGYYRNAIAAYNIGNPVLDKFGNYINQDYVDDVDGYYKNTLGWD